MKLATLIFSLLVGSFAFASGTLFVQGNENADGYASAHLGLNVVERLAPKLAYVGYAGYGNDPIYNQHPMAQWFQTSHGVRYSLGKKWDLEGGYNYHYLHGVPEALANDNSLYAKVAYKLW